MDGAGSISSNLSLLRARIAELARASGRAANAVRLIAVSKTHPVDSLRAAFAAGQRDFGESTVQEALPKIAALAPHDIEWHFVGHLQTNKAKFVPGRFAWLHSLDSAKLAARLARAAQDNAARVNVLIEVNVTGDPAKHGVAPADLAPLLEAVLREAPTGILLRGLMTIGPYPSNEDETRRCFARLRELRDEQRAQFGLPDFTELSMGMSDDYAAAIAEGATMVRLGTAIFGTRTYSRAAKATAG